MTKEQRQTLSLALGLMGVLFWVVTILVLPNPWAIAWVTGTLAFWSWRVADTLAE